MANTTDIYNLLLTGRKIQLEFDSMMDAETFRVRIHKVKAAQEKHLLGIGMMSDDEVPTFSFRYIHGSDPTKTAIEVSPFKYEMAFVNHRKRKDYNIVIVDEPTDAGS